MSEETDEPRPDEDGESLESQSLAEQTIDRLDRLKIKNRVDEIGLDAFIKECARLAALSGAGAGLLGFAAAPLTIPADGIHVIFQHLRVSLAVIYDHTGSYEAKPLEILKVAAMGIGLKVGATQSANALARVLVPAILARISYQAMGKAVPVIGAGVGGGFNYLYIRRVGRDMKAHWPRIYKASEARIS